MPKTTRELALMINRTTGFLRNEYVKDDVKNPNWYSEQELQAEIEKAKIEQMKITNKVIQEKIELEHKSSQSCEGCKHQGEGLKGKSFCIECKRRPLNDLFEPKSKVKE